MSIDLSVVERIVNASGEIAEKLTQMDDSAGHEPDSGDDSGNARNDDDGDVEIVSPPLKRPRRDTVPDQHHDEREYQLVDDVVGKHAPRDDTVAEGIF